jgi:lysophospholipase L1-like esterase
MKIFTLDNLLLAGLCLLITACGTDISESLDKDADPGSADFSTFVAVGDSLTAGYKDGALYRDGQLNSYPAILAQQFAKAGGGAFAQPLRSPEATGSFNGIPTTSIADRLVVVGTGDPDRPVTAATINPTVPTTLVPMPGMAFNNFGVPGAKSFHLGLTNYGDPAGIPGGTANPFYVRFATNPAAAGSSVIGDAAARLPTFFILWIGNNDILLNATAGMPGTGASNRPTFGTGSTDVTMTTIFDATYPTLVTALKTPTNKGVLINIPNVTSIPYFTTVPYDAIPLDAGTAATLNAQLAAGYNLVLNAAYGGGAIDITERDRRFINFKEGQNPVLINDETLTDISGIMGYPAQLALLAQARPATEDDLILLPASAKLGEEDPTGGPAGTGGQLAVWGVTQPLIDTDVLIDVEVDALEAVRSQYNATIAAQATAEIALFDAASLLEEVAANGLSYGSGGISTAYIQGGGFSLDGVHPTARGYAVIANEIMKVIEDSFGAKLPPVNPSDYSTVFYQK